MAIYCSNLFLYPFITIGRASTVSGKSGFRSEVMIWRRLNALKCRSHPAEDAGITSAILVQVGHGSKCIDPLTHCLLCAATVISTVISSANHQYDHMHNSDVYFMPMILCCRSHHLRVCYACLI